MADTFTPNYNLVLPEVGGSPDTWGNKLNENFGELDTILRQAMPLGGIIMWSGSVSAIPTGWALCDGSNGTPDLRNRFIVGAGDTYAVGDTGGANSVTLTTAQMPAHSHSASTGSAGGHTHSGTASSAGSHSHSGSTNSAGNHRHNVPDSDSYPFAGQPSKIMADEVADNNKSGWTNYAGDHSHSLSINANGAHTHSLSINSNGAHTHTVSVGDTGGSGSHENRPPYYALAYIMKI